MMTMSGGRRKGVQADINITPYIDILLVLLIIFMIAAPLKHHEQPVRVPQLAGPEDQATKPDTVVLDIDKNRTIIINQQTVALEDLQARLLEIYSRRANRNLLIRGDADLPYGDVFKVLDIAKRSGVADIGLVDLAGTNPPPQRASAK